MVNKNSYPDWYTDHLDICLFAKNYINENDTIGDIVCGNGYGSKMIAFKTNANVIGADISSNNVEFGNRINYYENLSFKIADVTNF